MKEENNLINNFKNLYNIFHNHGFDYLMNYCYSYSIKDNEYLKDISKIATMILNNTIKLLEENRIKYSFKEENKLIKINIIFSYKNYPSSKAKVILPVFAENYLKVSSNITKYIIANKINCSLKILKQNRNDILSIYFFDFNDAEKFTSYYVNNDELKKDIKRKIINIIPQQYDLGICTEINPYNYFDSLLIYLCKYFKTINSEEKLDYEELIGYLNNYYKNENKILKKEMIKVIIESLKILKDNNNPFDVFKYNENMNIGSFDISNYNLRLDENKLIYFENHEKTLLILFGTEEYLNICYSKFYKNVIEKNLNNLYYTYFKNIYIKILESRYEDIDKLLDFSNANDDIIYQELMLISSAYFAYKKMNFSFDNVNMIIKKILEKKLNCEIKYELQDLDQYVEKKFSFPFNIEYGNKIITLKNGELSSIYNYFRENNVLEYIPIDCVVNLKDGLSSKGEEFLKKIYLLIPNYDNFNELIKNNIDFIEYNN